MMTEEQLRAAIAADPTLRTTLRKKWMRNQIRLQHSIAGDVEIHEGLKAMSELGAAGVEPRLTSSGFDEVFKGDDSDQ